MNFSYYIHINPKSKYNLFKLRTTKNFRRVLVRTRGKIGGNGFWWIWFFTQSQYTIAVFGTLTTAE